MSVDAQRLESGLHGVTRKKDQVRADADQQEHHNQARGADRREHEDRNRSMDGGSADHHTIGMLSRS